MNARFSPRLEEAIGATAGRYPHRPAALLPVLRLVQTELGAISPESERRVAELLGLKPIHVREVVSFYSMLLRKPAGRYHLQVCTNLSCALLGGPALVAVLRETLNLRPGETTADGMFSLSTVECLGACEDAPCLLVNEDRYGRIDREKLLALLDELKQNHAR
jgi:NADH-quinone oxidoreductase subunit E